MSFGEMVARLRGEVPGISSILARNQINEALSFVYDSRLWSFQLKYDGWLTPGLIGSNGAGQSTGTITVDPYDEHDHRRCGRFCSLDGPIGQTDTHGIADQDPVLLALQHHRGRRFGSDSGCADD
jgi:hypothetical protein